MMFSHTIVLEFPSFLLLSIVSRQQVLWLLLHISIVHSRKCNNSTKFLPYSLLLHNWCIIPMTSSFHHKTCSINHCLIVLSSTIQYNFTNTKVLSDSIDFISNSFFSEIIMLQPVYLLMLVLHYLQKQRYQRLLLTMHPEM